jgi:hypothetical protein
VDLHNVTCVLVGAYPFKAPFWALSLVWQSPGIANDEIGSHQRHGVARRRIDGSCIGEVI